MVALETAIARAFRGYSQVVIKNVVQRGSSLDLYADVLQTSSHSVDPLLAWREAQRLVRRDIMDGASCSHCSGSHLSLVRAGLLPESAVFHIW